MLMDGRTTDEVITIAHPEHSSGEVKILRPKRLSTNANVHIYIEKWDKGILKFNKFWFKHIYFRINIE